MEDFKIILGQSPWLELAAEDWHKFQPSLSLHLIDIKISNEYRFDINSINNFEAQKYSAFVAWGPDFLNFQRMELMLEFKKRGFKMPYLINPTSQIARDVKLLENTWIQAYTVIGPKSVIGVNSIIGMGTRIGVQTQISNHVWLGQDVRIGNEAKIGSNSIIGNNVIITDCISIGKQVNIEFPLLIDENWPDKQFSLRSSNLRGNIIDNQLF